MSIERFIRFVGENGNVAYGEIPAAATAGRLEGVSVEVLSGDPFTGLSRTGKKSKVTKLLCPLESTPIILGIGLNYARHAKEANLKPTTYPPVFIKLADAMTGPYDDISVHPDAQSQLDYEGELTVIIGKDAKNIKEAEALDYVLGYTVGNDVSARNFQAPEVSGNQYCYAKSFDGFAPIGPAIATSAAIPDPQKLKYTTKVNGEIRQATGTDDMIWSVKQIIAHLSRGMTLRKGTAIMTGTPSGVGLFMEPKGFLKSGDVVEVAVEGIGAIVNKVVFE